MNGTSIAIFGASVTQQRNGYAYHLRHHFTEPVHIFGHGGMNLLDAGVIYIDRVLAKHPSYCFVDWFSTGDVEISDRTIQCIDTIIYRFTQASCKLVFLFFAHEDHPSRAPFEEFCKRYLESRNIYYIDVKDALGDMAVVLRDEVHTSDRGSIEYSEIIYQRFLADRHTITLPRSLDPAKYTCIRKLRVNRRFGDSVEMEGNAEVIAFMLTVGPHSGVVEFQDGDISTRFNTWDAWCHFRRRSLVPIHFLINGGGVLKVLQDSFDTSSSRRPFDYDLVSKQLIVHDIYYTDGLVKLVNKSVGRRLQVCDTGLGALARKARHTMSLAVHLPLVGRLVAPGRGLLQAARERGAEREGR